MALVDLVVMLSLSMSNFLRSAVVGENAMTLQTNFFTSLEVIQFISYKFL